MLNQYLEMEDRKAGPEPKREGRGERKADRHLLGSLPLNIPPPSDTHQIAVLTASQYRYLFIGLPPSIRPEPLLYVARILYTVVSSKMPKPRG